ncbi:LOW QUALITY PROTEIN: sodium-coupled neutral amino acid transporter 9 homolog [Uloborus diversus]|uniref:LOW QUALITY PROTEIN: sodium-coupled neutral amino acid transporter 9 homolog n=1 Tax=Uloborus diversus TaxID=327109 RepID=UPI00240A9C04|nr:LOW QUALITY PROTEIN: sodium-coupled neutral amino acid transporter 9 homolog [Uloborus diversus]
MEPNENTPLLQIDENNDNKVNESINSKLNNEDAESSDSNSCTEGTKRRSRLPFHYPPAHKNARVRREAGSKGIATYHRYRYYNKLAGTHLLTLWSIPDHVVPETFFFPFAPIIKPSGKQNSVITIFSIWNTMMGSSLLSIPWAIQQAGFAGGMIIMFAMGSICFYTAYRIVSLRCVADFPKTAVEFPDLCRHLLGKWAEWVATFFSLIPLLGGAVVYWVLMSNFLYFIGVYAYESLKPGGKDAIMLNSNYSDVYCPGSIPINGSSDMQLVLNGGNSTNEIFYEYWDMDSTIPFYIAACFAPLVSLKSPTFFTKLNALGTLSVIYLMIFIVIKGVKWGVHFNTVDKTLPDFVHLFQTTFPVLVGTLSLSFFIHNCVLSIMRNQKKPENNARDLAIAYVLVGATYLVIGVIFFITFPFEKSCIEDNLLNNFRSNDLLAVITRVFLLFQILTLYPLIVYILRVQIMHFAFGSIYPSWKHVFALNMVVLTICILFNVYLPRVGTIIRYCGAISGLAYIFTLPCVTYMKALKEKGQLTMTVLFLHICIIILGICNFISQFFVHAV